MKRYAVVIVVIALAIVGALWVANTRTAKAPDNGRQACTEEAKLCPDGSAVGRTGPNCEFAQCPATSTSTTTATSTTGGGGILPYNSGVRGEVVLGPTCPVERIPPDPTCAPKPYATAISVERAGSRTPFIIGNSNASGAFQFSLPPGSYTLKASGGTVLPHCSETSITVASNTYATTTIYCDTGIR